MLFSNMTLNPQPLHIDRHFCEQETEWGQPLMNSLFTLGLMIGIQVNRPDGRHHHRQSRHDRGEISASAVRGRHRALHDRGASASANSNSRPGAGIVEFHHRAYNQNNKLVAECRRQAFMRMRPALASRLRLPSCSFPADSGEEARQGHGERRRRADRRSGGFDLGRRARPPRARPRSPSSRTRARRRARPRLLVRVNGLETGLTDADLDAVVAGRPDAIMLPKAEGGAGGDASRRQARGARGDRTDCPTAHIEIVALATETAAALFLAGTYRGASPRLDRADLGRRGSVRRARRGGQPRRGRPFPRSLSARAQPVPCRRGRRAGAGDRHRLCRFPQRRGAAARNRRGAARRLHRQDGDPSGAGRGHQRGVHADAGGDRQGAAPWSRPSRRSPAPAWSASTA